MIASGCAPEVARLLEEVLLAFQERNSFGIIQGVFPSDLLGNFYFRTLMHTARSMEYNRFALLTIYISDSIRSRRAVEA
jgi:hypothetical protein